MIGKFVLVRTYSAGIHCGTLEDHTGTTVILSNARRIWSWTEAFSLSELSQNGGGDESRISIAVPEILLTQAIEVIPCSEKAIENLSRTRNN